jgi:hypothetical protein
MKKEYVPIPNLSSNSVNIPVKKIEKDDGIDLYLRQPGEDESDDELGEDDKEGDSHAEDESDDEMGEKGDYDDGLVLEDESDDE